MKKNNFLEIKNTEGGKGLFSKNSFSRGDIVHVLEGDILEKPTRESVEVYGFFKGSVRSVHIMDTLFMFCNHSFAPNIVIDKNQHTAVAIADIEVGEEVCFNYITNESQITNPFTDKNTNQRVEK